MAEALEKPKTEAAKPGPQPPAAAAPEKPVEPEPAPDTADKLLEFLRSYKPDKPASTKNKLEQFTIHPDKPLPEFSSPIAKAYVATRDGDDKSQYYAVITKESVPLRTDAIKALKATKHAHMVELAAAGKAEMAGGIFYALIFARPKGITLAALLQEKPKGLPERFVIQEIIKPLNQALLTLKNHKICHGGIRPDRIYFNDRVILGECLSEPCGYSQHYLFEPPERITATGFGKGDGDNETDCFALGMLALQLVRPQIFAALPKQEDYTPLILSTGVFNLISRNQEFSPLINDFLRGTLNDKKHERWDSEDIAAWSDGKKYNLMPLSSLRDGSRSYPFNGEEYYNSRALAHAFHINWDKAVAELKTNQLGRWIELNMHKPEMAEAIHRTSRIVGDGEGNSAKLNNELVARSIIILDHAGPMRLRINSFHLTGIGAALADYFVQKKQENLNYLMELFEADLHTLWYDQHKQHHDSHVSDMLYKLHKLRTLIKTASIGFGMERALYDLNPSLPCQSPLLLSHYCLTLDDLVTSLDSIAGEKAGNTSPMDRHIAGFVSSRLDLNKEVKISELAKYPQLGNNAKLLGLKLLSQAQEKTGGKIFKGLSHWMAVETWPLLDAIHNRTLRKRMQAELLKIAKKGKLGDILQLFANAEVAKTDYVGFNKAMERYHHNAARMMTLKDKERMRREAEKQGHHISLAMSYVICCIMMYIIARQYLMF